MRIVYHIRAIVKDPTQGEIHKHMNSVRIRGKDYFGAAVAEIEVEREIELTEAEDDEYCRGLVEGCWEKIKEESSDYQFQRDNFNILAFGLKSTK